MCLASGASPITTRPWPPFATTSARGLPIQVNDPAAPVTLVYVDDVVERFVQLMDGADCAEERLGSRWLCHALSTQ
jgi:hypothetical protein